MNERQQITTASYGSGLLGEYGFDPYGFPKHIKAKVGSIYRQDYRYAFNALTGNLTTRKDSVAGKINSESFTYDNLSRLETVTGPQNLTGTSAQTLTYQPANKGNINTKSDAGTYSYDATRKYAVNGITTGQNISTTSQLVTYNVFNKVATITEGTKTAEFVYNADRQRIRMTLKTSGATTKTLYYFGGSCEREIVGSTTTQYIWIGGDAYTAVAVAKKVGTGSWTVYNIFRDHLGTITHLKNGSTIDEYSFDAWGRRRDKDTWSYTLSGEPALFAERGFTGHEFLSDFNLYNMNGRLYDPVVGRFLSPDPYITDPSFSQSYNRYSYALNNPLKFTDPSGESWKSFWKGVGNMFNNLNDWMVQNNIQAQIGVNMSGSGTVPFARASGPNFNIDTRNFVQAPTAGYQKINQQLAGFSGMGNNPSPQWNMPMQQFVGESPLADGIASSNGGPGWEAYAGTAASIGSEMFYSKTYGTWMGKNFKMYQQSFHGNGSVGGMNKFGKTTSNAIKWGGRLVGAYSGYKTIEQRVNGEIGTGWMSTELGTTAVSTFGGLYGAAWGVGWELGRAIITLDAYQEFKFNFWYNRWENQFGPPSQSNEGAWYYFYQNYRQ